MNRAAKILLAILFIIFVGFNAIAQDNKEEADAYKAWYDANNGKEYLKATRFAKAYLEKFPTGRYAEYLKDWSVKIRPAIVPMLFNQARDAKNIAEEIKLGQEALAGDPENLDYLYLLSVDIRTNELQASPPNYTHAKEASEYILRVVKLIEAGKVPNVIAKEQWNEKASLAFFYHTLSTIEKNNQKLDEAIKYNAKSIELDNKMPLYTLTCGGYQQERYIAAAKKYESFPAEDRQGEAAKPEAKAALEEANSAADAVIECWAKFLALTETNSTYKVTREKVQSAITDLYKYRHPDSPDGLQKLIEGYRPATQSTTGAP